MKKKIIILLCVLMLILLVLGIYLMYNYEKPITGNPNSYSIGTNAIGSSDEVEEEGETRKNIGKKMSESQTDAGVTINNIQITSTKDNPELVKITYTLTNTTKENLEKFWVSIDFFDAYGIRLNKLLFDVELIKPGETVTITSETSSRIIDSYEYKFKKLDTIVGTG